MKRSRTLWVLVVFFVWATLKNAGSIYGAESVTDYALLSSLGLGVLFYAISIPLLLGEAATAFSLFKQKASAYVVGTTGSLGAFYSLAEIAQGRLRFGALRRLPALIMLGAGLAPHLTRAVVEGLESMAGEFVRTPKKGSREGRYRARASLPLVEVGLCMLSMVSVIASLETRHWFATPFAMLFAFGYGYVALLVASEQTVRWREARAMAREAVTGPLRELAVSSGDGSEELAA